MLSGHAPGGHGSVQNQAALLRQQQALRHGTACTEPYNQKTPAGFLAPTHQSWKWKAAAQGHTQPSSSSWEPALPTRRNPAQQAELRVAAGHTTGSPRTLGRTRASGLPTTAQSLLPSGQCTGQGRRRWQRFSPAGWWLSLSRENSRATFLWSWSGINATERTCQFTNSEFNIQELKISARHIRVREVSQRMQYCLKSALEYQQKYKH